MSLDSLVKRSARSSPRPIVLPSMIPDTDSDSATSADMSASRRCCSVVILPPHLADPPGQPHEQRHEHERDHRQLPVQDAHRDDRRDHRRRVLGDRRRGGGDDVVEAADVVGDPRLHLARAGAREERQRHPLQVPVDGGAQVVHHPLADRVRHVRLPDAERGGGDRDRDHRQHQPRQQRRVVLEDPLVEHVPEQERVEHRQGPPRTRSAPAPRSAGSGRGGTAARIRPRSRSRLGSISGGGFLPGSRSGASPRFRASGRCSHPRPRSSSH